MNTLIYKSYANAALCQTPLYVVYGSTEMYNAGIPSSALRAESGANVDYLERERRK